jgi:hypothetical protein
MLYSRHFAADTKRTWYHITMDDHEILALIQEDGKALARALDIVLAMTWVLAQFVPKEDIPVWIERGKLAIMEESLTKSGNE